MNDRAADRLNRRLARQRRWPAPTTPTPTIDQVELWTVDGGCEATDGCWVEPDGRCEHGHVSWMLWMGLGV